MTSLYQLLGCLIVRENKHAKSVLGLPRRVHALASSCDDCELAAGGDHRLCAFCAHVSCSLWTSSAIGNSLQSGYNQPQSVEHTRKHCSTAFVTASTATADQWISLPPLSMSALIPHRGLTPCAESGRSLRRHALCGIRALIESGSKLSGLVLSQLVLAVYRQRRACTYATAERGTIASTEPWCDNPCSTSGIRTRASSLCAYEEDLPSARG